MSKPINLLGYKNISAGNLIKKLDKRSKSWKKRTLGYQKEKRQLQIKVRDLSRSKEKYKQKCISLEKIVGCDKQEFKVGYTKQSKRFKGSLYPSWQVEASINWYLQSSAGFRACGKGWQVMSKHLEIDSPSYGVIRQWVLRLGLYKLQQRVEKAEDWVYIIDYSIQMGTEHCLVILGFRMEQWRKRKTQSLRLEQMQVLDLLVTEHPNGEQVRQSLHRTMERTGVPLQIMADGGKKISKGQQMWKEDLDEAVEVILTYDVSHLTGCVLKKLLSGNAQWEGLVKQMSSTQKRNQQSYAGFMAPLSLRKTARYMNLYAYVDYLERLLAYHQAGDFSLLARSWTVNKESIGQDKATQVKQQMEDLKATSNKELMEDLDRLAVPTDDIVVEHDGKKEFESRFGGLIVDKLFILALITLVKWIRAIQKELKTKGLSKQLVEEWKKHKPKLPDFMIDQFWQPLMDRLTLQVNLLPDAQNYLATSDIIESLFGQYKSKVNSYWLKGMSALVLAMPALTGKVDAQIIQQALEKIKIADVQQWFESQRTTASFLSKRKKALPAIKKKKKGKNQHKVVHIKVPPEEEKMVA